MVTIASLWLPIVLSAVVVFLVSSVLHMVLKYHSTDYKPLSAEDRVMAALREFNIAPGDYIMPHAKDMKDMQTPEYLEKQNTGPRIVMTVMPNGNTFMGRSLAQWFAYSLVVGLFVAYVTTNAVGPGGDYMDVFRVAGTTAFAGYALALMQSSIWWMKSWSSTLKSMADGLIYALCTAGVFGWLWP